VSLLKTLSYCLVTVTEFSKFTVSECFTILNALSIVMKIINIRTCFNQNNNNEWRFKKSKIKILFKRVFSNHSVMVFDNCKKS
jgi:hypothetical protein